MCSSQHYDVDHFPRIINEETKAQEVKQMTQGDTRSTCSPGSPTFRDYWFVILLWFVAGLEVEESLPLLVAFFLFSQQ